MEKLKEIINEYGLWISKEKLIEKAYRELTAAGHHCYILNERYIGIDGEDFQIVKSVKENRWIAKRFC